MPDARIEHCRCRDSTEKDWIHRFACKGSTSIAMPTAEVKRSKTGEGRASRPEPKRRERHSCIELLRKGSGGLATPSRLSETLSVPTISVNAGTSSHIFGVRLTPIAQRLAVKKNAVESVVRDVAMAIVIDDDSQLTAVDVD